jgi:Rrf2 family nitric oxide-sensitive transcriptional repressor
MFSSTIEYALRAMAYLASEPMGTGATQDVAEQTDVPSAYMAKVFQHLRRGGLVQTQRGVGGGIKLAKSPDKISLLEIVEAVEPLKRPKGPNGRLVGDSRADHNCGDGDIARPARLD